MTGVQTCALPIWYGERWQGDVSHVFVIEFGFFAEGRRDAWEGLSGGNKVRFALQSSA